jgi:hypothetical protein
LRVAVKPVGAGGTATVGAAAAVVAGAEGALDGADVAGGADGLALELQAAKNSARTVSPATDSRDRLMFPHLIRR